MARTPTEPDDMLLAGLLEEEGAVSDAELAAAMKAEGVTFGQLLEGQAAQFDKMFPLLE